MIRSGLAPSLAKAFDGDPEAKDGMIDLAEDKPGFGLPLKTPDPKEFRLIT